MDKSYKGDIPRHRKTLEELKRDFSKTATKTNWVELRIEPLLDHVMSLERILDEPKFSSETKRLSKGVSMFHSDLVYLRTNIQALKKILADETRSNKSKSTTKE